MIGITNHYLYTTVVKGNSHNLLKANAKRRVGKKRKAELDEKKKQARRDCQLQAGSVEDCIEA